jgi:hypothetical protein
MIYATSNVWKGIVCTRDSDVLLAEEEDALLNSSVCLSEAYAFCMILLLILILVVKIPLLMRLDNINNVTNIPVTYVTTILFNVIDSIHMYILSI